MLPGATRAASFQPLSARAAEENAPICTEATPEWAAAGADSEAFGVGLTGVCAVVGALGAGFGATSVVGVSATTVGLAGAAAAGASGAAVTGAGLAAGCSGGGTNFGGGAVLEASL